MENHRRRPQVLRNFDRFIVFLIIGEGFHFLPDPEPVLSGEEEVATAMHFEIFTPAETRVIMGAAPDEHDFGLIPKRIGVELLGNTQSSLEGIGG